nr:WecB/TagA/CpsF family glycosyltransferase [Rhizobium halophytocola]
MPIFGLPVYDLDWEMALAFIASAVTLPVGQVRVAFLNANNANILHVDRDYREILAGQIVLPDGFGIDLAAWALNGTMFKANLNGTDLVPALLTYMEKPMRIGLIGGKGDVVSVTAGQFRQHAPWHTFIPVSDGFLSEKNATEVAERLSTLDLDILMVGMGTPLQEKWMARHIRPEHARLVFGVGALFEFVSGRVPRAPPWMRRLRFEWAYRMACEPARLWRRYIVGIPLFFWNVALYRLFGQDRMAGIRSGPR